MIVIYGGSMYGAADPIYMLILIKVLGPEYVVWDKAASLHFKKPGTSTLFTKFVLTEEEISTIKKRACRHGQSSASTLLSLSMRKALCMLPLKSDLYQEKGNKD